MADEGSWWDGASTWLGDNWGEIAKAGVGAYGIYQKTKGENAYNDYLRENERLNAERTNAYNDQLAKDAASQNAASYTNSAAQIAAMQGTEANRMAAALQASKYSQNMYRKLLKMYEPYRQTAEMLLPQKTQTYQNSLALQNAMGNYVSSPDQMAKLNASVPAYNVNIPLPDSVRIK